MKTTFIASPFSGIVGCGIHRADDPRKVICLIPAQFVAHKDGTSHNERCKCIKHETERIAAIVCRALNESEISC